MSDDVINVIGDIICIAEITIGFLLGTGGGFLFVCGTVKWGVNNG